MKILVLSDTHLEKFDQKEFDFLKKLIPQYDKVILNGDFFDGWFTTAEELIHSKYKELFPLLLEREAVYINGNHDPKRIITSEQSKHFSIKQVDSYKFEYNGVKYLAEHGDRLEAKYRDLFMRIYHFILIQEIKPIYKFLHWIERILYKISPKIMTQSFKGKKWNSSIERDKETDRYLLIGHTHVAEVNDELGFANSGCIKFGYYSYLSIDDDGVHLHQGEY